MKTKILTILLLIWSFNTVIGQNSFYNNLSDSTLELTKQKVIYDPSYFSISYPNGDVPSDRGVCTDVVIRAYRKVGIDLQKEVHEDMKQNFDKYQKDRIGGINNKQNQKVGKFTKNGKFIEEYHSIRFAARENKVNQGNLTACVNGRVKSAGGFIWKRLGIKYKSNSPIMVGENNK